MLKKPLILLLVVLMLGLLLAGCDSLPGGGAVQDAAQTAVCQALTGLDDVVGQLGEISADATVAEIQELVGRLEQPVGAVRSATERLTGDALTPLFAEYDKLVATVNELPADATLDEAQAEVQAGVDAVQAALAEARNTLNCSQ